MTTRLTIPAVLIAMLLGLSATAVLADFSTGSWRFVKAIRMPEIPGGSLVALVPDTAVLSHAAPGLSDVRVIETGTGTEIPYKLLIERGESRRSLIQVAVRDLGHVQGVHTSFVVDLGQNGQFHNEIEIQTASQNFQRQVIVEGSVDSSDWSVIKNDASIFDFTIQERNFNTRDTRVRYPSTTVRYLRIRIIDGEEGPLDITGVLAFFNREIQSTELGYAASIVDRQEHTERKLTRLIADLGVQGVPINRLAFDSDQENFYRELILEGSVDLETWTNVLASGNLFSYQTPKFVGEKLDIAFSESTFRYYRLTVFNEDNPILPVQGVHATGIVRKLVFQPTSGRSYGLYYGADDKRAPSYDFERIFPYLVTEILPTATLGQHTVNELFLEPPESVLPFTERYPWMLPTVVALASMLVGLLLAGLLRQIRSSLPPPS